MNAFNERIGPKTLGGIPLFSLGLFGVGGGLLLIGVAILVASNSFSAFFIVLVLSLLPIVGGVVILFNKDKFALIKPVFSSMREKAVPARLHKARY